MKRIVTVFLVLSMLFAVCYTLSACDDGASGDTAPTTAQTQEKIKEKLNKPTVALAGNTAIWVADPRADRFEISLNGELSYVENTVTSKVLTDGQTMKVRAIGDGVNYLTSDWSDTVTYIKSGTTDTSVPGGTTDTSVPGGTTDTSTPGGTTDTSTPGGTTDTSVPGGTTDTSVPGGTTDTSAPGGTTDTSAPGGTTDTSVPGGTTDTSTPGGTTDSSKPGDDPVQPPIPTGKEPTYLGIIASQSRPVEGLIPESVLPRRMVRGNLSFGELIGNHFQNSDNHLGTYPTASDYDIYSQAGETVYIQIWLNNPDQYTILSLMLNGTKYQVGGGLSSFFVAEGGQNYNCVYVAVTIPTDTYIEKSYTVTNIEYIANTYINADGTDEFMNENDTVVVGLPYSNVNVGVSTLEPTELTTEKYKTSFTVTDAGNILASSGSWLGLALYNGDTLVFNKALSLGNNTVEVEELVENTSYVVEVYIYGDLHDGQGVKQHTVSAKQITTQSAVDYFEVEAGYYQHWDFPEAGQEADSGLSINVSLSLTSPSATFDRLELYIGDELVYTDEDFNYYTTIEDLLAETTYRVRIYYSDKEYSEHYVEEYVTTGKLEKPKMNMTGKYAFLNSAAFTFDYLENGFLRIAIAKNVRVRIHRTNLEEINMANYILELCDDPSILDKLQAEYDAAIERDDWGTANILYHEKLYFYQRAAELMNYGDYSEYGTDKSKWQELFDRWSVTIYLGDEDFFTNNNTAYLIVRDYFSRFESSYEASFGYEILADVNYKDGRGFVTKELNSGSIYNFHRINSEYNSIEFDCEINGMNVKVNPYFRINYEDNKILVVSYEIGIYTTSGELVDTLYESKEVNWADFDEEAWIEAYILAMKGEAILPSEEQIIKEFGWRAIFEILLNIDFGFEDDYTGGGADSEVVVRPGDGTAEGDVVVGGGGRGEKNIANQRERQILRDLLTYDYPEDYEYDLKTSMLESFMCDEYYWDLINGIDDIDMQLEALISGALNSSIDRVISDCESGIRHFLTWFGSEKDEIYIGFKAVIESYLEDTGKMPVVDWAESYRRIMMFEDFYYFYPFGYVEDFEIDIEDGKYPTGEYIIGIKYRYDSYEEGDYEVRFNHYNKLKITGKLPTPTFEISDYGYVENLRADVTNFYGYYIEVEIVNAQGEIVHTGRYEDWSMGGESPRLLANWKVRARTVFNEGATSDLYKGDSEWSDYQIFEGMRIDAPNVEYSEWDGAAKWYAERGEVSHFVYIINDGVAISVPKKSGEYFLYLKNGDTLRVKAVPTDEAKNDGYIESVWVEYTCVDTREMLATPTLTITGEGKETYLEWNEIPGASHYLLEITRANGETYTREEYGTISYGLEAGSTYHIRAISDNSEVRSSLYSNKITFAPKLANPEFYRATQDLVMWRGVTYAQGYYYKIGENGQVQEIKGTRFEMSNLAVGDSLYVQAFGEGCESSDWVLIYTRTSEEISKG